MADSLNPGVEIHIKGVVDDSVKTSANAAGITIEEMMAMTTTVTKREVDSAKSIWTSFWQQQKTEQAAAQLSQQEYANQSGSVWEEAARLRAQQAKQEAEAVKASYEQEASDRKILADLVKLYDEEEARNKKVSLDQEASAFRAFNQESGGKGNSGADQLGLAAAAGAASIGLLSGALIDVGDKSVEAAEKFETFNAQLKTLMGAEQGAQAQEGTRGLAISGALAVTTNDLEQARVKLATFGIDGEEALKRVSVAAEATGKSAAGVAAQYARVYETGGNAVRALRQLGIVQQDLIAAGAEMKNGKLFASPEDTESMEKFRAALDKVFDSKFGAAANEMADTLGGKMKLFGNLANEVGAEIGDKLLPTLKSLLDTGLTVAKFFTDLPEPVKAFAVAGGVAATSALALTAGIAGLPLLLQGVQGAVAGLAGGLKFLELASIDVSLGQKEVAIDMYGTAVATGVEAAAVDGLAASFAAAKIAAIEFAAANPWLLALTAIGVAVGVAVAAVANWEEEEKKAQKSLQETSQALQKTRTDYRELTEAIRDNGGGGSVENDLNILHKMGLDTIDEARERIKKLQADIQAAVAEGHEDVAHNLTEQAGLLKHVVDELGPYADILKDITDRSKELNDAFSLIKEISGKTSPGELSAQEGLMNAAGGALNQAGYGTDENSIMDYKSSGKTNPAIDALYKQYADSAAKVRELHKSEEEEEKRHQEEMAKHDKKALEFDKEKDKKRAEDMKLFREVTRQSQEAEEKQAKLDEEAAKKALHYQEEASKKEESTYKKDLGYKEHSIERRISTVDKGQLANIQADLDAQVALWKAAEAKYPDLHEEAVAKLEAIDDKRVAAVEGNTAKEMAEHMKLLNIFERQNAMQTKEDEKTGDPNKTAVDLRAGLDLQITAIEAKRDKEIAAHEDVGTAGLEAQEAIQEATQATIDKIDALQAKQDKAEGKTHGQFSGSMQAGDKGIGKWLNADTHDSWYGKGSGLEGFGDFSLANINGDKKSKDDNSPLEQLRASLQLPANTFDKATLKFGGYVDKLLAVATSQQGQGPSSAGLGAGVLGNVHTGGSGNASGGQAIDMGGGSGVRMYDYTTRGGGGMYDFGKGGYARDEQQNSDREKAITNNIEYHTYLQGTEVSSQAHENLHKGVREVQGAANALNDSWHD